MGPTAQWLDAFRRNHSGPGQGRSTVALRGTAERLEWTANNDRAGLDPLLLSRCTRQQRERGAYGPVRTHGARSLAAYRANRGQNRTRRLERNPHTTRFLLQSAGTQRF